MEIRDLLMKGLERTSTALGNATKDLRPEEVKWRPGPQANPIGFILWHVTRGEDRFVHTLILQKPQVWEQPAWRQMFPALPSDPALTGSGFTAEQVAAFQVPKIEEVMQYHQAVRSATLDFIRGTQPGDLDKTIDHPRLGRMTYAEILLLLLGEVNHHIGQIDYVRGLAASKR